MASPCVQDVTFPECESSHVGKLCLQLNCNSDCVHVLRSMVAVMTVRAGLDELQSNRVAIAVDEVFANIAAHAYEGKPGRVEFETQILHREDKSRELVFYFRDYASVCWAGSLEGITAEIPDAETLCPGGLGLKLIRAVADNFEHEILDDGNRWQLGFVI
jgi:anti-sigma regulatory factor (Ser/Thr protein kinase)